jgi:hypothetical protein
LVGARVVGASGGRMMAANGLPDVFDIHSLIEQWKHFVHDLDPPTRLSHVPLGITVAFGMLALGIAIAIIAAYINRK